MSRGPQVSNVRFIIELCVLRVSVETYVAPKGPVQFKRCQRFGQTQRNCGYAPRCVACGGSHLSAVAASVLCLREQPHGEIQGAVLSGKKRRQPLQSKRPSQSAPPKTQRAGPSAEKMDLGEDRNHVVRGGRDIKTTTTPPSNPNSKHSPQPVTEVPRQPKVTATRQTAGPKKPEPKSTAATKPAAGKF